jgi:hypothetical protein
MRTTRSGSLSSNDKDMRQPAAAVALPVAPDSFADADLARVVTVWPDLPEAIRRAVLALIGTATP